MDCIFLREIRLDAKVGIYKRERVTSQLIELDLDIALPGDTVFQTGKIADTVDYAVVVQRLRDELAVERFGLVEELAEHIARVVLEEYRSPWVRVSVAKLGIIKGVKRVGVTIERTRPDARDG